MIKSLALACLALLLIVLFACRNKEPQDLRDFDNAARPATCIHFG